MLLLAAVALLPLISCVQPKSAEQLAAEREKEKAASQEALKWLAAWKESAISPADLYAAYEADEAGASRLLAGREIALKGRVKNIAWEGVPEVSFFVREGAKGSVTCVTKRGGPSIQLIRDLDYTTDLYMLGKVSGGVVVPSFGGVQRSVMVLLEDCVVLW
jgi:hypothetical protein